MAPPKNTSGMSNDPLHDAAGRNAGGGKGLDLGAPPPVPSKTGKGSQWQQFVNYWAAHGFKDFKQNSEAILLAAKAQNIDPIVFGALILNESAGKFNVNDSSTGAVGIGQLEPSSFIGPHAFHGGTLPWAPKHKITLADLRDPGINLRLSAAYYGYLQGQYPSDAYGRYNAGPNADPKVAGQIQTAFNKKWITTWNPKYVPGSGVSTSPPTAAGTQVPGGTGGQHPDNTFHDPYVKGVRAGSAGKLVTTNDPTVALQYDGAPLTRSAFLTLRDRYTSHYVSYTGQRPTNAQIQEFLLKGWSDYTLDQILSKSKNFTKSPIYKQNAIPLQDAAKDALPQGAKVPAELLRQAVLHQWSASTLVAELRKLPTYTASNEFRGNVATLLNVHDSVQGNATPEDMTLVKDAALAGWTADQYAAYLRQQPTYVHSTEYQSKALTFLSGIGLITGSQPVIKEGATPGPGTQQPITQGAPPPDKRAPGQRQVSTPLGNMGVTLG